MCPRSPQPGRVLLGIALLVLAGCAHEASPPVAADPCAGPAARYVAAANDLAASLDAEGQTLDAGVAALDEDPPPMFVVTFRRETRRATRAAQQAGCQTDAFLAAVRERAGDIDGDGVWARYWRLTYARAGLGMTTSATE